MTRTARDVEAYLVALNKSWETLEDGTYVVHAGEGAPPLALRVSGQVLVLRVLIGPAPSGDAALEARVFRRLLELNASELVYGSYGLENGEIVLSAALVLESLDLNELEAALADVDLALARHVGPLRDMCKRQPTT